MVAKAPDKQLQRLPQRVTDFLKLVIKKMRYRKKVQAEVMAELGAHFEDELRECKSDEEKEQKAAELIANFGDARLLGILLRRAKKRCRPLWQKALVRSFQAIGIMIGYLLICSAGLLVGTPAVKVDYSAWLSDLVRAGRNETLNAKPYFDKAAETARGKLWPSGIPNGCFCCWPCDMNDREQQAIKQLVVENNAVLEVLKKGVEKPYYWTDYTAKSKGLRKESLASLCIEQAEHRFWGRLQSGAPTPTPMRHVRKSLAAYRTIACRLAAQILWKAYVGDIEGAFDDYLVLHKFGYHLQGKGLLMEQLVGIAVETLAHQQAFMVLHRVDMPTDILRNVHEELNKQLAAKKNISFEAEKAFGYDFVQRSFTDDGKGSGRVLKEGLPIAVGNRKSALLRLVFLTLPDRQETIEMIDEYFKCAEECLTKTPWQLHNEACHEERWNKIAEKCFLLKSPAPGLRCAALNGWVAEAFRRALLTVLAILRYQKEKGAYPADLEALVEQGYLSQLPMDPWSDSPLVYKKTDDDFTLYSVGENFEDDGGEVIRDYDGRVGMWVGEGDAVFWPAPKPETPEERIERVEKEWEERRCIRYFGPCPHSEHRRPEIDD
jgi:hypothetical protein